MPWLGNGLGPRIQNCNLDLFKQGKTALKSYVMFDFGENIVNVK